MALFPTINNPTDLINNTSWLKSNFFTNFGYIKDEPNKNDLLYSASSMITTPLEGEVSLKKYFKEISNQYTLSSCVSNATADTFEAMTAKRLNVDPSQVDDISRLFIYWNARNLSNPPVSTDSGSRISLAMDCMSRYGAPSEKVYPYDISKVNTRPSILAYREAIQNRISKYYRVDGVGDDRIFQMKQALSAGNPIIFGTALEDSFRKINNDAIIYAPTGSIIGYHCMAVCGWSDNKQAFEVRNSWGTGWGVQGYCWMDKNYLASDLTVDLWVPTI